MIISALILGYPLLQPPLYSEDIPMHANHEWSLDRSCDDPASATTWAFAKAFQYTAQKSVCDPMRHRIQPQSGRNMTAQATPWVPRTTIP
jgi:hypothetical protein